VTEAFSYVGHSTLLLEVGRVRLLTDPVLGRGVGPIRRRVRQPSIESLLPLDAVLLSHAHHDHLHPRSLRQVARECPVLAPRGCGRMLRRRGIREVIEVQAGDRVAVGGIPIEALPAVHDGRRYPVGRPRPALGFLIDGPVRTYFAGDTDLFPEMEELAGRVDVAALPVWGWGPRVPPGHLDPERAAQAAALICPRTAIPIHWGTLVAIGSQRGMDPLEPPSAFADAVATLAPDVEVRVLVPGERSVLRLHDDDRKGAER
jgi:L-ascorbate metabolism protein UlaG (beta-lactamase superfamily)